MSLIHVIVALLRAPSSLLDRSEDPRTISIMAPKLLLITLGGLGIFGAVVGADRGGLQILFAGIKLPFLVLIPALLALPALRALWATSEVDLPYHRASLAALAAAARTAILAAAISPVYWLFSGLNPSYHESILVFAACIGLVGLPGLATLASAVPAGGRRRPIALFGAISLLSLLTMQTGWLLRPFVSRPTTEATFLRAIESDVLESLGTTTDSAVRGY